MKAKTIEVTDGTFACAQCGQGFPTKAAATMHFMRVHTKAGRNGAMWKRNETHEQHLVRRRAYQKKLRERYRKEGKDSHGNPRPPSWKPRQSKQPKWTAARRRKFDATWEAKRAAGTASWKAKKKAPQPEASSNHLEDPRAFINNCPNCGHNLVAHYLAAGAVKRTYVE